MTGNRTRLAHRPQQTLENTAPTTRHISTGEQYTSPAVLQPARTRAKNPPKPLQTRHLTGPTPSGMTYMVIIAGLYDNRHVTDQQLIVTAALTLVLSVALVLLWRWATAVP